MPQKLYTLVLLALLSISMDALAETSSESAAELMSESLRRPLRHHHAVRNSVAASDDDFVSHYADSLAILRDSIYSGKMRVPHLKPIDAAPMFLPMTFYNGVVAEALSMQSEPTDIDKRLLSVYLQHPEYVLNTENRLQETGPMLPPSEVRETPVVVLPENNKPGEPDALPVDVIVFKPNFWTFGGDYYLQFLQNYLTDNWYQGGESNYSMMGSVTLTANYNNKQKVKWDNKLEMKFGMQTTKSDTLHKTKPTEDMLRYTGKLGLQATKNWYYTFQVIASTQFARHYKTNTKTVQSDLLSPLSVNLSIGMDYTVKWLKNRLTGSIHLAPLAYNFKYVDRIDLATRNGIDEGKHSLNDFGSQTTIDLTWKFSDNISWKTRLYGYTTYHRMDAQWENTFSFQFNKYLATKLFLYPRFDDGRTRDEKLGFWMFKEYVSIGFSYSM